MRGKEHAFHAHQVALGITPAYAGKSPGARRGKIYHKDHPRLCGEKHRFISNSATSEGSPPPMRGKALVSLRYAEREGITPAYAGKSPASGSRESRGWDHPHLCGEKAVHMLIPPMP